MKVGDDSGGIMKTMALVRFVLFWVLVWTPFLKHGSYDDPVAVGYRGWWNLGGMCLAFEREDGSRQYRW